MWRVSVYPRTPGQIIDGAARRMSSATASTFLARGLLVDRPKDIDDAIGLAPGHCLGTSVMAVATEGDAGVGPMGANAADQAAQMGTHLAAVRGLAGAQDGCHGGRSLSLIDMDRQKAALIIVRVEQRGWLMPVHDIEVSSMSSVTDAGTRW